MAKTILKNHDEATAKVSRDVLLRMAWADFEALKGVPRAMCANAMIAKDVPIYARVDRDILAKMVREHPKRFARYKGRTGIALTFPIDNEDHIEVTIGPEWTRLRADWAIRLLVGCQEDANLGADFNEIISVDDGHGGKMYAEERQPGYPGLIRFALTRDLEAEKLVVAAA